MKKHRVIPVLLLRNGFLVQSKQFKRYQNLGNPVTAVKRLSEWGSDELVYLDISRDDTYDMRRDDLGHANRSSVLDIIEDVSKHAFMPITVGGRIRSLLDIEQRLALGADKIAINTKAIDEPDFITAAAREFGAQCIVVSIDARLEEDGVHRVRRDGNREATGMSAAEWARRVETLGAGEILINSIDRDGMKNGYDLALLDTVSSAVRIPVIGCGGVGDWEHLAEGLRETRVDAVAAANIFHYSDQSVYLARQHLYGAGLNVRSPELLDI
ncbi:imidazole glycerol phosphate synthase cyclase subunit [Pseudoduganella sp. SL102]|uniref:imidazole glycerol phosphate synthase subunit HisF n=1 Tax=Pseudoduganella sp. SL102 TaxID=2995154 RepID=UPI00248AA1CB|nr:imidazole glycerol phosphate synthase cyclase subunit [Pseudoduganella sp. SL102]WBS02783.1 imidazole glycerol phosphate synthase cyclase subunit [Pseudoduganella sp. SL102]